MKSHRLLLSLSAIAAMLLLSPPVQGQEDPAHNELRALKKEFLKAYNDGDMDKVISYLDDNVVVTWQNGKVSQGPKEVKAFYEKMTKGPDRIVEKSTIQPEADALSVLYSEGDPFKSKFVVAIAWGHSKDHYQLTDGTQFDQDTRWSATVIKKDGKWKVASIHISVNLFDNPILHLAIRKTATYVGGCWPAAAACCWG